ncbi:MAG: class I SAM-dependent methyltransferase [Desulfobacteraceae bacterium]|nr:class I SAM-dependent methyltransferase [Desulfobacteraceae bacterium]MBC2755727.1 class I SAM-dependent methyltransferase [Desulfobacteraceae bacterium]
MTINVAPDWWKTLFDEVYLTTDARTVCNHELTCREIDIFCKLISINPDDSLLDFCGGHGRHSLELYRRGYKKCTVFDYSHTLLRVGAENAANLKCNIRFIQGDARNSQLEDEKYDHVMILGNSLGYVPDEKSDFSILSESFRVLRSKGRLLLDVTDGKSVRERLMPIAWHEIGDDVVVCRQREVNNNYIYAREMVLSKKDGLIRDKNYCIRIYEKNYLKELLGAAGFTDVNIFSQNSIAGINEADRGCMNHRLIITACKP